MIGELVMERLRTLDPIAYVRFASVYRQFADLDALREELEALASGSRPAQAQLPLLGPRVHPLLSSAATGRTDITNPYPPPGAAGADSRLPPETRSPHRGSRRRDERRAR